MLCFLDIVGRNWWELAHYVMCLSISVCVHVIDMTSNNKAHAFLFTHRFSFDVHYFYIGFVSILSLLL